MEDDFSKYMNFPECPVNVGDLCIDEEYLDCDTVYKVLSTEMHNGKWYAVCQYKDEFSGELVEERVYSYNLKRV